LCRSSHGSGRSVSTYASSATSLKSRDRRNRPRSHSRSKLERQRYRGMASRRRAVGRGVMRARLCRSERRAGVAAYPPPRQRYALGKCASRRQLPKRRRRAGAERCAENQRRMRGIWREACSGPPCVHRLRRAVDAQGRIDVMYRRFHGMSIHAFIGIRAVAAASPDGPFGSPTQRPSASRRKPSAKLASPELRSMTQGLPATLQCRLSW
jgi:hypothetical protein